MDDDYERGFDSRSALSKKKKVKKLKKKKTMNFQPSDEVDSAIKPYDTLDSGNSEENIGSKRAAKKPPIGASIHSGFADKSSIAPYS